MTYLWLVGAVVLGIIEAATMQLVSIWFAGGALAACIAASLGLNVVWQIVAFIGVSIVLLIATRPLVKRLMKNGKFKSNADGLIGKEVVLIEEVDNLKGCGKVSINGVEWSVRSSDSEKIENGEIVVIEKIEGVKLIVSKK